MKRKLVLIIDSFVRDAQRFNGCEEDCDDMHSSDDWVDVYGNTVVGYIDYETSEELKKGYEKFEEQYPKFTLTYVDVKTYEVNASITDIEKELKKIQQEREGLYILISELQKTISQINNHENEIRAILEKLEK